MRVHVLLEEPADDDLSEGTQALVSALRERDITVSLEDAGDIPIDGRDTIVVILDSKRTEPNRALEQTLASVQSSVIPVASGRDPSPTFADLSQILLGRSGPETAAKRISMIARYGGTNLADLFRLEALAAQWSSYGQPSNLLQRGSAVESGLTTLASASDLASADAAAFVSAGLAKRGRRRRRIATVVVAVASVLVSTSVVALVQRAGADRATHRADQNTAHTDSLRLAQLAVDTLASDPDLPWIYAQNALIREKSPEAQNAAQRVITASPAHASMRLPKLADGISGDPKSNTILIRYTDGSLELRSGVNGEALREFPVTATSFSLAPGGKTIQSNSDFIEAANGDTAWQLPAHAVFRAWGGPTKALISMSGSLAVADLTNKSIARTTIEITSSDQFAWSLAAQAPVVALVDQHTLRVVNLATGKSLPAVKVSAPRDVAISADGTSVFVASTSSPETFTTVDGKLKERSALVQGTEVVSVGKSWVVSMPDGGVTWVSQGQDADAYHYVANRGPTLGTIEIGAGRTASIGGDGFLRLWSAPPEQIAYPIANLGLASFDQFNLEQPWLRATGRSLITRSNAGDRTSFVIQSLNLVGTYDNALRPAGPIRQFPMVNWSLRPLPQGRYAYITQSGGGVLEPADRKTIWTRKTTIPQSLALMAANDDGTRIAYAGITGLVSFGATGAITQTKFAGQQIPVDVSIDQTGRASAFTSDGWWYRESTTAVHLPGVSALAAATVDTDGSLVLVGSDGAVLVYRDGKTTQLADVGADIDPFAVRAFPDSNLIAVLGNAHTVVLDRVGGAQLADLFPTGGAGTKVRDVFLSPDRIWEIRADGGVVSRPLQSVAQVDGALDQYQPRPPSSAEIDLMSGTADSVGER